MGAKSDERWLIPSARERIDRAWRERILVILEDLTTLPGFRYGYVASRDGAPLSETVGPEGVLLGSVRVQPPKRSAGVVRELDRHHRSMRLEPPEYLLERDELELRFTGSAAGMVLVAAFEVSEPAGVIVLRLGKRIRHLRSLQKTMRRGALYT